MSLAVKIRSGDGRVFRAVKAFRRNLLRWHVPVAGPSKALFSLLYRFHVTLREAGIYAARFFWYEPLFRSQCEAVGQRFQMERLPYVVGEGKIILGSDVRLSGKSSITFSNRGRNVRPAFSIGDQTFIGHGCAFSIGDSIRIGNRCMLAAGVHVLDQDGHPLDATRRSAGDPAPADGIKSVRIGDDVWIGSGAMILKGVSIGDRAVIGARSVVTKDVPPDAVAAGNPARVIREGPGRLGSDLR